MTHKKNHFKLSSTNTMYDVTCKMTSHLLLRWSNCMMFSTINHQHAWYYDATMKCFCYDEKNPTLYSLQLTTCIYYICLSPCWI